LKQSNMKIILVTPLYLMMGAMATTQQRQVDTREHKRGLAADDEQFWLRVMKDAISSSFTEAPSVVTTEASSPAPLPAPTTMCSAEVRLFHSAEATDLLSPFFLSLTFFALHSSQLIKRREFSALAKTKISNAVD